MKKIIDVHGHWGACNNHNSDLNDKLMSGNIGVILQRAKISRVGMTLISALEGLMPYGGDPVFYNREGYEFTIIDNNLKLWAIVNPKIPETYKQAIKMLLTVNCIGIKIHPTLHKYSIYDYGDEIFRFADQHNTVILTHSGCSTNPEDVCYFADKYKDVKIILAHLGNSEDGKLSRQITAIKNSKSDYVYVDTSSGCSIYSGLIEYAVSEIGSKKILFGSDTPLNFTPCMKARIEYAEITKEDKENIFYNNASQLFNIKL